MSLTITPSQELAISGHIAEFLVELEQGLSPNNVEFITDGSDISKAGVLRAKLISTFDSTIINTKLELTNWINAFVPKRTGQLRDQLIKSLMDSPHSVGQALIQISADVAYLAAVNKMSDAQVQHFGEKGYAYYYGYNGIVILYDPMAKGGFMTHLKGAVTEILRDAWDQAKEQFMGNEAQRLSKVAPDMYKLAVLPQGNWMTFEDILEVRREFIIGRFLYAQEIYERAAYIEYMREEFYDPIYRKKLEYKPEDEEWEEDFEEAYDEVLKPTKEDIIREMEEEIKPLLERLDEALSPYTIDKDLEKFKKEWKTFEKGEEGVTIWVKDIIPGGEDMEWWAYEEEKYIYPEEAFAPPEFQKDIEFFEKTLVPEAEKLGISVADYIAIEQTKTEFGQYRDPKTGEFIKRSVIKKRMRTFRDPNTGRIISEKEWWKILEEGI